MDQSLEFLTQEQKKFYDDNGYLILKDIISQTDSTVLKARIHYIIENTPIDRPQGVFTTGNKQMEVTSDDYFLSSANKIRIFLEEDNRNNISGLRINKIGHALHKLDSIYNQFTHSDIFRKISHDIGVKNPLIPQSMYIFKSPGVGGKVSPHQDSTFLLTEPQTCHAFWMPLEDVTIKNGCLWVIPHSHKGELIYKFKLNKETNTTYFEPPLNDCLTNDIWKEEDYIPLEVNKGDLVLLHGSTVHKSEKNISEFPRDVYTFHIIDANSQWSSENWLQYEQNDTFDTL